MASMVYAFALCAFQYDNDDERLNELKMRLDTGCEM